MIGISMVALLSYLYRDDSRQKEEARKKQLHEEWEREYVARQERYESDREAAMNEMQAKWGECSKQIKIDYSSVFRLEDSIYAFEEAGKIVIGGQVLGFEEIIGFTLINNSKVLYNAYTTSVAGKDLSSMLIRGMAGKVLAGDIGAVIGALSADDEEYSDTYYDSEEENGYKMYVNIDSITSPTITLDFESDEDSAYEAANLMNVIILRNRKQTWV